MAFALLHIFSVVSALQNHLFWYFSFQGIKERANRHDLSSVFFVAFYSPFLFFPSFSSPSPSYLLSQLSSIDKCQLVEARCVCVCVCTHHRHIRSGQLFKAVATSSSISQLTCQVFSAFSLVYLTTTTTTAAAKILAPPRLKEKCRGPIKRVLVSKQ